VGSDQKIRHNPASPSTAGKVSATAISEMIRRPSARARFKAASDFVFQTGSLTNTSRITELSNAVIICREWPQGNRPCFCQKAVFLYPPIFQRDRSRASSLQQACLPPLGNRGQLPERSPAGHGVDLRNKRWKVHSVSGRIRYS
jgi:hypothetical protein